MTATSNYQRRLPHWGWWVTAVVCTVAAANIWPVQTGIALGLLALTIVLAVNRVPRPRRPHPAGPATIAAFHALDATQFEHAITRLVARHPHIAHARHSGRTADRGMDIHATFRNGRRELIQCKRYKGNVGGDTIREIVGSVIANNCHHGTIVTTAGYTAEALATNARLGPHALTLIDGPALEAWANGRHRPWQ